MGVVNRRNVLVALVALTALVLAGLALRPVSPAADAFAVPSRAAQPLASRVSGTAASPAPGNGAQAAPQSLVRFAPNRAQARLAFLGGRITQQFFVSSPEASYTDLVAEGVRDRFEVRDVALRTAFVTSADVAAVQPTAADDDLVVLEVGTSEETPMPTFITQYAALTEQLRATQPDTALVCLGIWGGIGNAVDIEIQRSCRRAGGTYVQLSDLYERNAFRGPIGTLTPAGTRDDFHPNDGGHAAIASRILDALKGNPVVPEPSATPR